MRVLVFALLLIMVGCAPNQKNRDVKETTDLKMTLTDYHMKMKWGLWEQASLYIVPAQQEGFLGRHDELGEEYKIVNIEVKSVHFDGPRAEVETEREWYDEGMVVKKERFMEEWHVIDSQWRRGESMRKETWKKVRKKEAEKSADSAQESPSENEADMPADLPEPVEQ